jgi:hypothetical protein
MAHVNEPRGMRDEANVGPDPRQARNLVPLHDLKGYKVADGEPDIRGWSVFSSTGREVGRVDELLVDGDAGEVVMLDIDLRRDDRHTFAPIRAAWIDRATKRVVIDSNALDAPDLVPSLPRRAAATDDEVRQFDDRYQRAYGERGHDPDREYRIRRENEELRFRRRQAGPGAAPVTPVAPVATVRPTSPPESSGLLAGSQPAHVPPAGTTPGSAAPAGTTSGERRDFDRARGDRDSEVRHAPMSSGVEPDVLDAQTRAGLTAHPHGDRYGSAERVVERHPVTEGSAGATASPAADLAGSTPRPVRYPKSVEDESDERRRVILEEVVVRRRAVDPASLTEEERAQLRTQNPDARP